MLHEAELFVMAEHVLVEVLGRIREADEEIMIPPMFDLPGADRAAPIRLVVEEYAFDDACVPDILAGRPSNNIDRGRLDAGLRGEGRTATIAGVAGAAVAAAREVTDGDAVVHAGYGDVSTRDYLLRLTIARSLVAHYVATYLGSTACPLPEELARPLWALTEPEAATWR
ncbi:MAG TPA: hypothetical protein VGN54_09045, partial [Mycobacteriales bacterium]|nr:hypothetical protein [Mycobacteriales bacterium]